MTDGTPSPDSELLIACLCARWCGTCNDYAPLFMELRQVYPKAQFVWVDIEDEADLVDPIEVENFPTILIAVGSTVRFFGTVTPHIATLRRLIESHAEATAGGEADGAAQALADRLRRRQSA